MSGDITPAVPHVIVVGSINLDLVARVSRLPVPGETVSGAELRRFPGGKGANQALAAKRLGAEVSMIARVGNDAHAEEAQALLRDGGVDLSRCTVSPEHATGVAMISVDPQGENQIVVAPGANRALSLADVDLPAADALICQLEVPVEVLVAAAESFHGLFCVNLAPARDVPEVLVRRADLIIVNETEAAFYGTLLEPANGIVVTTLGGKGAIARDKGNIVAQAAAPVVEVLDTVGAGDAFTAALVVAMAGGAPVQGALEFACVAGALATTKRGAQPSLPYLSDVQALM
jgi:ribokinase